VAQPAGTTRRQTEGAPAARLARWTLRAAITVTALGAPAACSKSSDPVGKVTSGPATGDAAKIEAVDGDRFTSKSLELPAGEAVTIEISNTDDRAHDFAIEAANLNTGTIQGVRPRGRLTKQAPTRTGRPLQARTTQGHDRCRQPGCARRVLATTRRTLW
jgi:hypothetical protein